MNIVKSVGAVISLGAFTVAPAQAQDAQAAQDTQPPLPTEATAIDPQTATRRSFTPADFTHFAPRTALDMVQRIPGFTIEQGGGDRGLGQADANVLINGQRISGKSNGPVEALSRISAESVVRLDIVDGASLDIGGLSGQVLNVIADSSGGVSGQFRYSPQFRTSGTSFRWGDAEVSLSGGGEQDSWTLGLENSQNKFGDAGPEFAFDGADVLIDTRQEQDRRIFDRFGVSGTYARNAANGNVLNLNGQVNGFIFRSVELSERTGIGQPDRTRSFRSTEDEFNFEVGADYAFATSAGRLKLIGYHRYENSPTTSGVLTSFADGSADAGSLFTRQANEAETIVRSELTFNALDGDWQASAEGVRNFLDIVSQLEQRDAAGTLQPVVFPGATARVDEDRVEATLTYGRTLAPELRLQVTGGAEYSQISQSGQFGKTRSFLRPKGSVSLDWQASEELGLSFKIERSVGQLDFFDFISTVNVNQGEVDVTNADLVPPQSWFYEVEARENLGALGSLTMRGFYEAVSDIVDQVPIAGADGITGQAPGNIDAARRYGVTLDATLLSEPLGWKGGRVNVLLELLETEVADPLLGTKRRISNTDYVELEAGYRQDLTGTDWAAGFDINFERQSPEVRLDQIGLRRESFAFASIFVENKDIAGLTLRARIANVLDRKNDFARVVFDDRRAGSVAFREERFRTFGTIFTLDIEGSF